MTILVETLRFMSLHHDIPGHFWPSAIFARRPFLAVGHFCPSAIFGRGHFCPSAIFGRRPFLAVGHFWPCSRRAPPSPTPLHAAPHSARVVCRAIVCSACMHVLTRVPGPPIWVTRLGSPASPRIVPVDAAACRAYRDPGSKPLRDRGLRGHLPAKANFVFVVLRHQAKSLAAAKTVAMRINIGGCGVTVVDPPVHSSSRAPLLLANLLAHNLPSPRAAH